MISQSDDVTFMQSSKSNLVDISKSSIALMLGLSNRLSYRVSLRAFLRLNAVEIFNKTNFH